MSDWLLVPGRGGKHTSPTIIAVTAPAQDADGTAFKLDMSRNDGVEIQLTATSGVAGTFQLEESVNGTQWANFGTAVTVTDGAITKYEAAARPFSLIRVNPTSVTGLDSTHSLVITFCGHAIGNY